MKILVCIKQIPAPAETGDIPGRTSGGNGAGGREEYRPGGSWFADDRCYHLNPYDEHALEEALRLREQFPETTIDTLSVGPDRCRRVLRRALELGADRAIQLRAEPGIKRGRDIKKLPDDSKPPSPGAPPALTPYETSAAIAAYLADQPAYDLIFTGVMAEDGMAGQTGQLLAELLGIPCATAVVSERLPSPRGPVYVEREEDGGDRTAYEIDLPALLTIQSGINRPRYPALSHVLRARTQEIITVDAAPLLPAPRERTVHIYRRESSADCRFLTGTLPEQARQFLDFCRKRGFLSS
ncbi:MAG TPA: electron transfer flavoprotein subunit beta/FixA family protein [Syntrophales bacterium]|nr:electron transfer flavoprotein subunit beta/FixA family protein [Syntrophales bacterium]